jgi:MFS family permease
MEKGFSVDQYGYLIAVYSLSSLIAVLLLGAIKLGPRARFWVMSLGFSLGVPFFVATYFSNNFILTCIFAFLAGFLNCAGNTVFNASMMLALPEENRSAILGFIRSSSIGGTALSTLIYGFLGDIFPLYLVFSIGSAISLIPMIYMSFHPRIKKFVLENHEEKSENT